MCARKIYLSLSLSGWHPKNRLFTFICIAQKHTTIICVHVIHVLNSIYQPNKKKPKFWFHFWFISHFNQKKKNIRNEIGTEKNNLPFAHCCIEKIVQLSHFLFCLLIFSTCMCVCVFHISKCNRKRGTAKKNPTLQQIIHI